MSLTPRLDKLEKNYLLNGMFDLWQRGAGPINSTTSLVYRAMDMWRVQHTGTFTGTPNVRQSTTVPSIDTSYSLRHDFRRNASTATLTYEQRIEADQAVESASAGFGSVSLMINPPVAGTVQITVKYATVKDNHTSQTNLAQSTLIPVTVSGWQEVKFENFVIDSNAAKGLAINIQYVSASGTDGSDVSMFMTKVSFSATKQAVAFSRAARNYEEELQLCYRYYFRFFGSQGYLGHGYFDTTTALRLLLRFPKPMRVAPSIAFNTTTIVNAERPSSSATTTNGLTSDSISPTSARFQCTAGAASTVGFATMWNLANATDWIDASAEL